MQVVSVLREAFEADRLWDRSARDVELRGLASMLAEHEQDFAQALWRDLGKSTHEAFLTEISVVGREIREARRHLATWMAPQKVPTPFALQPATSRVQAQPLGVVLIIGPWNYPLQLVLAPLVGALAAGNCVVLKPAELAVHTSRVLAELLPRYVSPEVVRVIEGGAEATTRLLQQPFNHIFYTGGARVGKIIRQAAVDISATCTLELGGKCPCIVDENTDLAHAAQNIIWGKFLNAGQTCVAPDYVLVHRHVEAALLNAMQTALHTFYGDDPRNSPDYGRIISRDHHRRIVQLMQGCGKITAGGTADEDQRYIAPTILQDVPRDALIMDPDAEIFGPVLPVLSVDDMQDAIAFIRPRPEPLAIYLFSSNPQIIDYVTRNTRSGALSVNATMVHLCVPGLPFGGIGGSGSGKYHGKFSFDTFSHQRALFDKRIWPDPAGALVYPPCSDKKRRILNWVL